MKVVGLDIYIEQAEKLDPDQARLVLERGQRRLRRREDQDLSALEIIALELRREGENLKAWREQWSKISERKSDS